MSDIEMRVILSAVGGGIVTSAIGDIAKSLGSGGGLGNALGNITFGFRNMGTAGTIGTDALKAGFSSAGKIILETAAVAGVAVAGLSIAIGTKAVQAAGDFQVQMTKLYTTAGESKDNLKMVGDGILTMTGQVGTGAKELGDAMYWIESANLHGKASLDALRVAAQAAKAENANLTDVSKALGAALNSYAGYGLTDAKVMNILTASTGQGMMSMGQLADSLKNVLPASATFHISLTDVTAALSTMTSQGDDAASAATHLKQMILALEAPSKIGASALKSVGLTSQQIANEMKISLPGAVQMITDAVGKKFPAGSAAYNDAIKNIAGGNKQMMGFLELSGAHLATFNSNVKAITGAVKAGGNSIMGWSDIQQNFNFKIDAIKASMGAWLIQLGTQLFPVFNQLMTVLTPIIMGFMQWITSSGIIKTVLQTLVNVLVFLVNVGSAVTSFFQHNAAAMEALKVVLVILAVAIGVILVGALYIWISTAIMAGVANLIAFWPVYLIVAGIVLVIALVVLAVMHWGQIMQFVGGIFSWLGSVAHTVVTAIGAFFSANGTVIHAVWNEIASFLAGVWNAILGAARSVWGAISGFFVGLWNVVSGAFMHVWQSIWSTLVGVWNVIKMVAFVIFALIVYMIIKPFVPLIDWFQAHWTQIHAVLTTAWNTIKSVATAVWSAITGWITTQVQNVQKVLTFTWNLISGVLSGVWNSIKGIAITVWSAISDWIGTQVHNLQTVLTVAWNLISGVVSGIWNGIKDTASTVWALISSVIMGPINALQTSLSNAWDNIKNGFSTAMNSLSGIASSAWNSVSSAIKSAIDGMIGIINSMINGVNNVTSKVGVASIPDIPLLAQGGNNLAAGPYIVGDAGPEMLYLPGGSSVVPMSRAGAGGYAAAGGGPTNNINIYISTMAGSPAEVRRLGDLIEQEMGRRFRTQTSGYSTGGLF